jgi:hypothetical protein
MILIFTYDTYFHSPIFIPRTFFNKVKHRFPVRPLSFAIESQPIHCGNVHIISVFDFKAAVLIYLTKSPVLQITDINGGHVYGFAETKKSIADKIGVVQGLRYLRRLLPGIGFGNEKWKSIRIRWNEMYFLQFM